MSSGQLGVFKSLSNTETFRAFRSTNYLLYFLGRSVSQFGTYMQRTAVVWVVYTITHSAWMIGLTMFAELFPSFLLSVFGGVAADRYDRFRIVKMTQVASMIQATLLAVLMMMGHYVMWEILVLSVVLGIVNAFDVPARQAMIHEVLEDKADLPNALSLNSAMANVSRLLGPAASGLLLEHFGAGVCFLANAASFLAVMVSIAFMKIPQFEPPKVTKKVVAELKEGFVYLKDTPVIGLVILLIGLVSMLVTSYDTLLPIYAKDIFNGNAATYGYMTSFIGVGAVAGTVFLASAKKGLNLKNLLLLSTAVLGASLIAFSFATGFVVAMVFAVFLGYGTAAMGTLCNIIVQSESAPHMRGRAVAVMLMGMFGLAPLGSLLVGAASHWIGPRYTFAVQGVLALLIAVVFTKLFRSLQAKEVPINQETFSNDK